MINALEKMRQSAPLVHCITNYVAMNIAANTLLAAGASPAMIHTPEETGDFAKIAGALTINIGTISPSWFEGMKAGVAAAKNASVPWVLDPVAHFATPYRTAAANELMAMKPDILRGNASEILGLGGGTSLAKGVDAADSVKVAEKTAVDLAKELNSVVVITGEIDFVTNGADAVRIGGGSAMMPKVTAMGCSLTCLMGAFAAVTDPMNAAVSGLMLFAEAGHRAEKMGGGPGTFSYHFLDALQAITTDDFAASSWIR
jgi:hydroxyethylthiazole kinase